MRASSLSNAKVIDLLNRFFVPVHVDGVYVTGSDFVPLQPALGQERSGQWTALPSEDWIVLKQAQWLKLLPAGKVGVGTTWDVDEEIASELLTRFYPTTENNDLSTNRIERQALKA